MNKNEIVTVEITDFTKEGEGIGHADGYTLFVKDAVIGDTVRARITRPKKGYAYARMEEILTPSKNRTAMRCPEARRCGGCRLQEYAYDKQLEFKQKLVLDALRRVGGFSGAEAVPCPHTEQGASFLQDRGYMREESVPDSGALREAAQTASGTVSATWRIPVYPALGMDTPYRYRNKAQYPIAEVTDRKSGTRQIAAGFYAGCTHSLIPIEDCLLTHEVNAGILKTFLDYMSRFHVSAYDEMSGKGLVRHLLVREGFSSGEILVCPVVNGDGLPHTQELIAALQGIPGVKSICININKKPGNTILGAVTRPLLGDPWIRDELGGHSFRISPRSFFQVNPVQTEVLYGEALRAAALTGTETVYDLYCGIGTISLYMASHAREVYGVEIVSDAVRDARQNAAINGVSNVHFYEGAAEQLVTSGSFAPGVPCPRADVVMLDPPRKGCAPQLIEAVRRMDPDRIVYVSCDPATLARDLRLFAAEGEGTAFRPIYVQPVDMFPQSCHIETCALLVRESICDDDLVSIKVDLDGIALDQGRYIPPEKPTYKNIKQWILDKYGFNVSTLNIAQIKDKAGIKERKNYNTGSGESKVLSCPPEKEEAIMDAFRHFNLI